jgi:hypothetical protein
VLDNIRMDLGEVGWGDVDWIGLAQDRDRWRAFVNSVLNLRVPQTAGKLSSVQITRALSSSARSMELVSYYDTSRKVAGLRPDVGNYSFFNLYHPFSRTRPWGLLSL